MVVRKLRPARTTIPVWQALLDAGNDVWVASPRLREAGDYQEPQPLLLLLRRWEPRGWVEERKSTIRGHVTTEWRLTLHGRQMVRSWFADVERERQAFGETRYRRG